MNKPKLITWATASLMLFMIALTMSAVVSRPCAA